jgi:L-fuconolactonase
VPAPIDAHVHFWDPARFHYDWLEGDLRQPFLPAQLLHDARLIFVQADCRDDEGRAEVEWVAGLGDPRLAGIVAHAPLERAVDLEPLRAHPLVVGVRRLLQGERDLDRFANGINALGELPFDACVTEDQLPELIELVDRCPEIAIVLDHLGKPQALDPWRAHLRALAERPHVHCKLSGLPAPDPRPYVEHALAVFGPERCLAGSDWPVTTRDPAPWFALLAELAPPEVLGENAARLYLE